MTEKWYPCVCTIVMGVAVILLVWLKPAWADTALYIVGAIVILKGLINKCCCSDAFKKKGESCCCK